MSAYPACTYEKRCCRVLESHAKRYTKSCLCVKSRTKIRPEHSGGVVEAESLIDRTLVSRCEYPGLRMQDLIIAVAKKVGVEFLQSCIGSDERHCVVPILESMESGWRINGTVHCVQIHVPQDKTQKVEILE